MNCVDNLSICEARCCKELSFRMQKLTPVVIYYYETHGCKVKRLSRDLFEIIVPMVCPQLEDNKCKLHGKPIKPYLCRKFGENKEVTKKCTIPKGCIYGKERLKEIGKETI